jgi:predicted lipoprotein with Yx(FWY)xxD motif
MTSKGVNIMKNLKFSALFSLAILATAISTTASAGYYGSKAKEATIITDNDGMTLYTFDKDKNGQSACYDGCAQSWPPYLASEYAKPKKGFKIITRKDGTKQWAYKNQPLYTWVGDTKVGDTNGDGISGVWHVAKKGVNKSSINSSSYGYSHKSEY